MCHKCMEEANHTHKTAKTFSKISMSIRIVNQGLHSTLPSLYIKIKRSRDMKKLIVITLVTLTLSSCGTAQGVMNGIGEVLTGMAVDARSVGSVFN